MPNRVIKGSINFSASLSRVSWDADFMFRCLLTHVDDFGRCDGRATILRAGLWPNREVSLELVQDCLDELTKADGLEGGPVEVYWVDGRQYLQIRNWEKHCSKQRRAKTSKWPAPEDRDQDPGIPVDPETSPDIPGHPRTSARGDEVSGCRGDEVTRCRGEEKTTRQSRSRSVKPPPSDSALMLCGRFRAYVEAVYPGARRPTAPAINWARRIDDLLGDPQRDPPVSPKAIADTIDWLRLENPKRNSARFVVQSTASFVKKYDAIRAVMEVPHATPAPRRRDTVRDVAERWAAADAEAARVARASAHDSEAVYDISPVGHAGP